MSDYGTVQVGRVTLREDRDTGRVVNASTGGISLKLTGQQSSPNLTSAQVETASADIISGYGALVPVVFQQKTNLNGYYSVDDYEVDQSKYVADGADLAPWTMTLDLVGSDTEIDMESRLGGAQTRANGYTLTTGERWHCPPGGAIGYYVPGALPTTLTRTGVDGAMTIYRTIPYGSNPRWGCPVASYQLCRTRFLNDGIERTGIMFPTDVTNWELSNSLVRVAPLTSGGALAISAYTGGAWQVKNWDVLVNGVTCAPWTSVSVLQNDYHKTSIRLMKTTTTVGRITLDVTLRRGSRFAELYLQCSTAQTIKFVLATANGGTQAANHTYILATTADGAGNKYMVASAGTYTADVTNGGISAVSATTKMDAMIGVQISGAAAGDLAADVYNQYLGIPSELVTGVRR